MPRVVSLIISLFGTALSIFVVIYAAWHGETAATVAAGAGLLYFQREFHRDADRED